MLDLAIRGGTVVTETGQFVADVGIEGDKIAAISQAGNLGTARREVDAEGLWVLPGVIDIHFHVRAPAHPARGTFSSETQAAAHGGVTTLLEMPISSPACARHEVFVSRRELGEAEAYVNFGLYGAPGLLERDEVLRMADAGACGFKIFTHAVPAGREDEFVGICVEDEGELYQVLELVHETGRLVSIHAENERLIQLFEGRARSTGRTDPGAFLEARPPVVEAMAVAQMAALCQAVPAHVHIAHVSCAAALDVLRVAQQAGLPMTGETCPHYLFYRGEDMLTHGPFAMIKPPLRTAEDQAALWAGLHDGTLMAITTDHSPFTLAEKEAGLENIWQGAIGAPGIEALVPVVMTEVLAGRLTLDQAVRFLAVQPAKLFQMYPYKGSLQVGTDADITIYDPRGEGTIDSTQWYSKSKVTDRLYQGRKVLGHVAATVVNGALVYADGQIVGEAGGGRFVRPQADAERLITAA